jgi:hypothetical protein
LPWVLGVVLLAAAGFGVTYLPRARARDLRRRTAWSAARAAITSATISRDAAPHDVAYADELLARAESLTGGVDAADEAADCARKADQLYREAVQREGEAGGE